MGPFATTESESSDVRVDLERLSSRLAEEPGIALAVLFGSAARGRLHAGSDIDLFVATTPEGATESGLRFRLASELSELEGRDVDVVIDDGDEVPTHLRFEIARDGVVLLEREAGAWVRFKQRAMRDWYDFEPFSARCAAGVKAKLLGAHISVLDATGGSDHG